MTTHSPQETTASVITAADIERILVQRTGVSPATLEGNRTSALVDLGIDSLAVLELHATVFGEFGVELPDDAMLMSVEGMAAFVRERQGHR